VLDFEGKGGAAQRAEIESARLARVLREMDDLPGYEVLKYRDGDGDGAVVDVRSEDVNAYIQEHMGREFTAKDFRTWAGTVAARSPSTRSGRSRAPARASAPSRPSAAKRPTCSATPRRCVAPTTSTPA
jgi:DNA topoisomerase IB